METNNISELSRQSIQTYLDVKGVSYQKNGRYLKMKEHDSCIIDTRITKEKPFESFYWNSRGVGGDIFDFLTKYEGLDNKTAYKQLVNLKPINKTKPVVKAVQSKPYDPTRLVGVNGEHKDVKAYLELVRGIETTTVNKLFDKGLLRELSNGNAAFIWKDKNNNEVGSEIQGTVINHEKYGKRGTLKKISPNSKSSYGFNFDGEGSKRDTLYVFESPIDALSFNQILNKSGFAMHGTAVSLNGAGSKLKTIDNILKERPTLNQVCLALDSDRAGISAVIKFIKEHKELQKNVVEINDKPVKLMVYTPSSNYAQQYKDWNESLVNGNYEFKGQYVSDYLHSLSTKSHEEFVSIVNELGHGRQFKPQKTIIKQIAETKQMKTKSR